MLRAARPNGRVTVFPSVRGGRWSLCSSGCSPLASLPRRRRHAPHTKSFPRQRSSEGAHHRTLLGGAYHVWRTGASSVASRALCCVTYASASCTVAFHVCGSNCTSLNVNVASHLSARGCAYQRYSASLALRAYHHDTVWELAGQWQPSLRGHLAVRMAALPGRRKSPTKPAKKGVHGQRRGPDAKNRLRLRVGRCLKAQAQLKPPSLAEGKSNANKRPFVAPPPQTPPLLSYEFRTNKAPGARDRPASCPLDHHRIASPPSPPPSPTAQSPAADQHLHCPRQAPHFPADNAEGQCTRGHPFCWGGARDTGTSTVPLPLRRTPRV